jgi:hypothetical protein
MASGCPPLPTPMPDVCRLPEATAANGVHVRAASGDDLAALGPSPVGFVAACTRGSCLHLLEMDVLPSRSRQGIGTRLLRHVCQVAERRGHAHVTLTTFAHLPWNAAFYAAHGFAAVSDCDDFPHLAAALRAERDSGLEARIAMVPRLNAQPDGTPINHHASRSQM